MVKIARGRDEEECYALRRLQQGCEAPPAHYAVWEYPLARGLVWIDTHGQPSVVRLSPDGSAYPTGRFLRKNLDSLSRGI
jgi:hypothetical protein